MKLYEIINALKLKDVISQKEISFQLGYKFYSFFLTCDKFNTFYESKSHDIIDFAAQRDEAGNFMPTEDGQGVMLDPAKVPEANHKLEDLLSTEIDEVIPVFTQDELANLNFTFEQISYLAPFVK